MDEVLIRETVTDDAVRLLGQLRDADRRECLAYGLDDYEEGIRSSVTSSVLCWSAFDAAGNLLAVFGVAPVSVMTGVGCPWMLGTDRLGRHSRDLMRICPGYIGRMLGLFPHLTNHVHAGNTTSVRWLKRLGFRLHKPAPYGLLGEPFHRFDLRRV